MKSRRYWWLDWDNSMRPSNWDAATVFKIARGPAVSKRRLDPVRSLQLISNLKSF